MRLKLDSESRDRLGLSVDVLGLVHDAAHLYTTGLEHLADQRDGHCVGAHAVAGDAAGGVGGASIGQTADTYGHVQPERHESAAAGLDRYLTT